MLVTQWHTHFLLCHNVTLIFPGKFEPGSSRNSTEVQSVLTSERYVQAEKVVCHLFNLGSSFKVIFTSMRCQLLKEAQFKSASLSWLLADEL